VGERALVLGSLGVKAPRKRASLDSFKILKVIGKGSFGKVFLVRERESGKIYAMKVLTKVRVYALSTHTHTHILHTRAPTPIVPVAVSLNHASWLCACVRATD
jgi:hypothetical protein